MVAARPSFRGGLGSEALKLSRQGMVWAMLSVALLLFAVIALAVPTAGNLRDELHRDPASLVFTLADGYLAMFNSGAGIFLLLVSARLVGMEYGGGTIRVLLSRGAGRLRVLLAKLAALAVLGLLLLFGFLVLVTAATCATVLAWEGSLAPLASLPATVWTDLGIDLLLALVSMGVCIVLGSTAAVVGRSVAFGVGAALAFFPLDNFGTVPLRLLAAVTGLGLPRDVTAWFLGPNLNALPRLMQTDHRAGVQFAAPLVHVDAVHAGLVVAGWAVALLIVALVLTRRRDVLQ
ncbi:MAG TPA: ABC transporter permease [Candidatus Dormibacteraeota bacterium]